MIKVLLRICVFLSFVLAPFVANASMQIFPTRIEFEEEKTETITIRNKKKSALTVQISPRAWHQDEYGKDQYSETDDLLVFPRMTTIDPGGEQTVRLRYRGKPGEVERAFRLLAEEVPVSEPGKSVMRFIVSMSVPIFVSSRNEIHDLAIEDAVLEEGSVHVSLKNAGTVHEQAVTIRYRMINAGGQVLADGEGSGWYVLAGRRRTFGVKVPEAPCRKAARIAVNVTLKGEETAPLAGEAIVNPRDCKAPPKPKPKKPALNE